MITLDTTTKSLEIVLSGSVTSNQLPCTASYADVNDSTPSVANDASDTISNNTTPVTILAAPGSGVTRIVEYASIYNADTVSATVTVRLNDNGTIRQVYQQTLSSGQTLQYTRGGGWGIANSPFAVSAADGGIATLGAEADAAASTDTGTFSLIALIKRGLQRLTTLLGVLPSALTGSGNFKVSLAESTATQTVSGTVTSNPSDPTPTTGSITAGDSGTTTNTSGSNIWYTGTASASSFVATTLTGCSTLTVQILGTWLATLVFEASGDGGTTWFRVNTYSFPDLYTNAGSFSSSTNNPGVFYCAVGAYTNFRIRCLSYTSGTASVTIQPGRGSSTVNITNDVGVNLSLINGTATASGNGTTGTGTIRVTISSDSTGQMKLASGANTIGALSAHQSTNVDQWNGVAPTAAAALADSTANPTAPLVGACNEVWNGSTWDRQNGVAAGTALASSAYTNSQNSSDITNVSSRGVIVTLNISSNSNTVALSVSLQYKDPISGNYHNANVLPTGVSAIDTFSFLFHPDVTNFNLNATNIAQAAALPLTRTFRLRVTTNGDTTHAATYSLSYTLIP